jgi:uncharacterized membrane protein (UPF0127 family)
MGKSLPKNISKNKILLILLVALFIVLLILIIRPKPKYPPEVQLNINNYNYYLEVASTPKQREIGLSNRESVCSNCGMLFVFPKEANRSFWMKDTLIPLDMIWLDKNYKIVKIATILETNSEKTYKGKAKYVIELNANEVFRRDLKVGDSILLPDFND